MFFVDEFADALSRYQEARTRLERAEREDSGRTYEARDELDAARETLRDALREVVSKFRHGELS